MRCFSPMLRDRGLLEAVGVSHFKYAHFFYDGFKLMCNIDIRSLLHCSNCSKLPNSVTGRSFHRRFITCTVSLVLKPPPLTKITLATLLLPELAVLAVDLHPPHRASRGSPPACPDLLLNPR